ncbi:MAG: polyhydroxyalkanoate depolymerase, partial [Notoacmeibacter sp.]|nr:polyhydroxyalkanoate depolymerase [Notoacmeibacter sp.]
MFYHLYEMNHAALQPFRAVADVTKLFYSNPLNPVSRSSFGRSMAAYAELFERMTRRYAKPAFDLPETTVAGHKVRVTEEVVWSKPFGDLLRFKRDLPEGVDGGPKLLIVAPMSGHYATLLRGTVEAMLPHADVHITDWTDARMVPVSEGR